jgi:radical SAM protein with 4Fe4S-binding SPASM domain
MYDIVTGPDRPAVRLGTPFSYMGLGNTGCKCTSGVDKLTILPNGYIVPCEAFKDRRDYRGGGPYNFAVGHVDVTTLEKALNNASTHKELNELRRRKIRSCDKCIAQ